MEGSESPLNIRILTTEAFPLGMAATNRIMTYAKGFAELNCKISVDCIKPTERPNKIFNRSSSGNLNGVSYSYSGGKTILDSKFITRRYDNFKAMVQICKTLLLEKKNEKTDVIIYYSPSTTRALTILLIAKIKNILFLKEESEFPSVYLRYMNLFQRVLFKRIHYSLFDGSLIMTRRLIHYFQEEKKRKKPYLHVPMTVDFERFSNVQEDRSAPPYIAYCGLLNNEKDGVDILLDSFAMIANEFPEVQLYLIGEAASEKELNIYLDKIGKYKLSKRIVLTGQVDKNEIPKLLCNARVLVLPRPASRQAEGGFPTKLGEYLATGKPVVVTSVGEIPDYMTDRVNVFMAEPGSVNSLASNMKAVLEDYSSALKIGEKGKEVVLQYFNYKIQTKNIMDFVKSFKK